MILVVGTTLVPAEAMATVRPAMQEMVRATRKEAGCVSYNLCDDPLEAGRIRISEEWESMAALDAHMETPHMQTWRGVLAGVGVLERAVNVYEGTLARSL